MCPPNAITARWSLRFHQSMMAAFHFPSGSPRKSHRSRYRRGRIPADPTSINSPSPARHRLPIQRSKLPKPIPSPGRNSQLLNRSLHAAPGCAHPSDSHTPTVLSAMPDRATDTFYPSNTLLKASPLFGTVTGCFLMKSALATSLV
jgi:hypothetical protein